MDPLPIRKIVFGEKQMAEGKFGLFAVSEVLDPAIQRDWITFNKQETDQDVADRMKRIQSQLNFKVEDKGSKDSLTIFGPILIPDMLIYRKRPDGYEYNLTADAPTIKNIVIDFFDKKRTSNVNEDHENVLLDGFTFYQSVITNEYIPVVKGYEDLPVGTAFLGAFTKDKQRIADIESGKYKGWSIHAAFEQELVEMSNHSESELLNIFLSL